MKIAKSNTFSHDIIFIDGTWGTGKSIIGPIISGMDRVEKQRFDPIFEYLCELNHLGELGDDATVALLRMYADTDQYHNLLGREINLRWKDDTGSVNNPGWFRYARRLFQSGGEATVELINRDNLALAVMSHFILPVARPMASAFGARLKLVEMVRHPLYMITHWQSYLSRFEGAREFTLSLETEGKKVPWFAADWSTEFVELSSMDKVLTSIVRLYRWMFSVIDEPPGGVALLVVSFEQMVLDPEPVITRLESFLGRPHHPRVGRILRSQKLPRERISQGKGHAAYGFQRTCAASEGDEYLTLLDAVKRQGSAARVDEFLTLISEYNHRWPSVLSQFA